MQTKLAVPVIALLAKILIVASLHLEKDGEAIAGFLLKIYELDT